MPALFAAQGIRRVDDGSPLVPGNTLSAWIGQRFSLMLAYRTVTPRSDQGPNSYRHARDFQPQGQPQGQPLLTTDNRAHDGSAGTLPAGV